MEKYMVNLWDQVDRYLYKNDLPDIIAVHTKVTGLISPENFEQAASRIGYNALHDPLLLVEDLAILVEDGRFITFNSDGFFMTHPKTHFPGAVHVEIVLDSTLEPFKQELIKPEFLVDDHVLKKGVYEIRDMFEEHIRIRRES